jgi:hypothetical protein
MGGELFYERVSLGEEGKKGEGVRGVSVIFEKNLQKTTSKNDTKKRHQKKDIKQRQKKTTPRFGTWNFFKAHAFPSETLPTRETPKLF